MDAIGFGFDPFFFDHFVEVAASIMRSEWIKKGKGEGDIAQVIFFAPFEKGSSETAGA